MSGITDEQRKELITELGRNGKNKLIELFESLDNTLRQYDPIALLSVLSGYGLTVGADDGGVQSKEPAGGLNQAHVELFQAFALRVPEEELGVLPINPDIVQEVWGQLIEIGHAFQFSRMNAELLESSNIEIAINQIQELIRNHTQMVRNWGFHSQLVGISREIYSHFDDLIKSNVGFSASNAIDVFKVLTDSVEGKLTERLNILSDLRSTKKPYDMVIKYHKLIGQGVAEADRFSERIDINGISQKNLFLILLSHFDLRMSDHYFIDIDGLTKKVNVDREVIENVLNYFSFKFGDLSDKRKEYFFLENPVWNKPIIVTASGYYCVLPQLFFSFVINTLDEIVEGLDKESLHKRRAKYLESKIEEIVKTRFPESQVFSGIKWEMEGTQYETDLIAFIDSHAIIIEAKSQKISRSALRGAPDRIKRHLEEILIKPGIQSSRLEQKLNILRVKGTIDDSLFSNIPEDILSINKVLRVSVSLEDFATLQTNLSLFDGTGWVPDAFVPCPSMNLADFETLFDFLEHPVQIIHYLLRRTEIEGKYKFIGDELDYMGLYITTLLNVGNIVNDDNADIVISGMSDPLDKYYISKDQGILIDKPQPKVSTFFKSIFSKLEERSTPRWTEIGCILNRFSPDDQVKLVRYIRDLSKVVNRNWQVEGHKNIAVYVPPESSEYALAVVLFKEENRDRRYEFIDRALALGLEPEYVKYCLVIAVNIDNDDLPYNYIALAENRDVDQ